MEDLSERWWISRVGACQTSTPYPVEYCTLTYLPHEAVAEVSKDKGPIGRGCAEFNWFESELMSDSMEVRFK